MPRTYKGGVSAVSDGRRGVDPLRPARVERTTTATERSYNPNPDQVARGILQSKPVMDALLRQMAWYAPEQMDALCRAWQEAKAGNRERLERYRTRPVSEWGW